MDVSALASASNDLTNDTDAGSLEARAMIYALKDV